MNHSYINISLVAAAIMLAGCQPKAHELAAVAESVIVGPEFSASKGLFVPEDTRRSLGLKVVEITEQTVPSTFEFSLRVYEVAGNAVRASAMLARDRADAFTAGQPVQVRSSNDTPAAATITGVNRNGEKATGLVELLVEISDPSGRFAVGSFVTASVVLDTGERVMAVPRSALIQATDGYSVYAVSGQHFVRTSVSVGAINADMAEIKDGLYTGDEIVSEPVMSLWMTELAAVKGGHSCCVVPAKGK